MLAALPLPYLLLMSAVATAALCLVLAWCTPTGKLKLALVMASVSAVCCLGMVLIGRMQYQHWSSQQMLLLFAFSWTGLAIGILPSRKRLHTYGVEYRQGVRREKYRLPARHTAFTITSVILAAFLAYALGH